MKSKKKKIGVVVCLVVILIILGTLLYMLLRKRHYNYKQINVAFMMTEHIADDAQYMDISAHVYRDRLRRTTWYLNMYNTELREEGKPLEDALSLDEVLDFYSSEYDENGEAKIDHLPTKIQNYLDWYYGFSREEPRIEKKRRKEEETITVAMFELGCHSERKNTQQVSDVVIHDPLDFYANLYVYNQDHPSEMITEEEMKMAMAGGPKEPLIRFGEWLLDPARAAKEKFEQFQSELRKVYVQFYLSDHPDAPAPYEMNETEIKQLLEYMETLEE